MTLQTSPADRREMVRAISERLGSPAVYLRMPTCAYRIGELPGKPIQERKGEN